METYLRVINVRDTQRTDADADSNKSEYNTLSKGWDVEY